MAALLLFVFLAADCRVQIGDYTLGREDSRLEAANLQSSISDLQSSARAPAGRLYSQTGYTLDEGFVSFFDSHGGVEIFGYPISGARMENGYLVQWTERERLELHSEFRGTKFEVMLGRLGYELTRYRRGAAFVGCGLRIADCGVKPDSPQSALFFPETRQVVGEPFLSYWRQNGGLAVFGYPISAAYTGDDAWTSAGEALVVQWFERARLEAYAKVQSSKFQVQSGGKSNFEPGTLNFELRRGVMLGLLGVEARERGADEKVEVEIVDSPVDDGPLEIGLSQGGESSDPGFFDNIREAGSELGSGLVRLDNIYNSYRVVSRSRDGKLAYNWVELDRVLDGVRNMGKEPFICLSYMPEIMSVTGNSPIHPPAKLDEWAELVRATVRHVNVERGLGVRYWEVWNEPNQWGFWRGSFRQYLDLYDATVEAVMSVDATARVGGPSFSNFEPNGINEFMEHARLKIEDSRLKISRSNLQSGIFNLQSERVGRVGFLSWHAYGQTPEELQDQIRAARALAERTGHGDIELMITEFNVLQGGEGDTSAGGRTDKVDGAISLLSSIEAMGRERLDKGLLFELKDGRGPSQYWGRWGVLTFDGKAKPVYHALKAYQGRPEGRLPTYVRRGPGDGRIGVMAYGGAGRSVIFVWNGGSKGATVKVEVPERWGEVEYGVTVFDGKRNNPGLTGNGEAREMERRKGSDLLLEARPGSLFILSSVER